VSQWCSVPRVPGDVCFPRNPAHVIVIIFVAVAIVFVFAVVVLTRHKYDVQVALGAVAATVLLSEAVVRRLPWRQRPDTA
jgi:hypothetical protein